MSGYYVRTQSLSVGYDGKALIRDIDIQVKRGEILTLIGPNGSGKSTILKTIIGQLEKVAGTVFLEDIDMRRRRRSDNARRVAIVTTERIRPELMSCRDVVSSGRYPYTGMLGMLSPEDHQIVDAALERVDAMEIADRPFEAVSDGQRQRIMLARAICQQPEIIILDEPTSFLDIRYKLELLTILKKMVREDNIAVILSLHELDLAERISDQVVCVSGEMIDRIGPPSEVFQKAYIAKLYHMEPEKYDNCFASLEYV